MPSGPAPADFGWQPDAAAKALAMEKFSQWEKMSFPGRGALEQATPEAVARYRAGRAALAIAGTRGSGGLSGKVAVDLCCGIGMDAVALAEKFGKVYAIDNDAQAIECAKKNAQAYGAGNIEFICADCMEFDLKKLSPDFVFADPSRRDGSRRVKKLGETHPNTLALIEFIKKSGIRNFCIEVSHELAPLELPDGCGREFISLGHEPNCTTLFFGGAARADYSVVCLPGENRLEAQIPGQECPRAGPILRYLFELDEGVVRFGMQKQLHDSLGKNRGRAFLFDEKFFGAGQNFASPFFKNSFKVLASLDGKGGLAEKLARLKAGKVVLRGKFSQEGQLRLKRELESGLAGSRKLHVFFFEGRALICANLAFR